MYLRYTVVTMKITSFFVAMVLLALPLHASAADVYADSVVNVSSNVWTSTNAVGAPDGAYADFRDVGTYLTLDMGDEAIGDLALHLYLLQFGAEYYVTFYDAAWVSLGSAGDTISLSSSSVVVENPSTLAYRYIKITSSEEEQWRLDAVEAFLLVDTTTDTADASTNETGDTPSAEPPTPSMLQGTLIKRDSDPAVYILGLDGDRHAFPSENVFTSWGLSFDDVETVDDATVAAYSLGDNVTIRPGTYLVKIQTNPKVFAVEPGGVLRWVASEQVALQLYGTDWASRVVDVSDAFWGNYTVGEEIDTAVHPDGTVIESSNGVSYYIMDASRAVLDAGSMTALRLSTDFVIRSVNTTILAQYASSTISSLTDNMEWPF